jgi:hypothetical protein
VLKSLAVEDEGSEGEKGTGVRTPQSVFGLVFTVVYADVSVAEEVVEPVTPQFADY